MLFKKSWLLTNVFDMGKDVPEPEGIVKIVTEVSGSRHRWYTGMTTVFEYQGKFYGCPWQKGHTEEQDNQYLESAQDTVELPEYRVVEKIVKVWEPVT